MEGGNEEKRIQFPSDPKASIHAVKQREKSPTVHKVDDWAEYVVGRLVSRQVDGWMDIWMSER